MCHSVFVVQNNSCSSEPVKANVALSPKETQHFIVFGRSPFFPLTVLVTLLAPVTGWITLYGRKWTRMIHCILHSLMQDFVKEYCCCVPPQGITFLMHTTLLLSFLNIDCSLFIDVNMLISRWKAANLLWRVPQCVVLYYLVPPWFCYSGRLKHVQTEVCASFGFYYPTANFFSVFLGQKLLNSEQEAKFCCVLAWCWSAVIIWTYKDNAFLRVPDWEQTSLCLWICHFSFLWLTVYLCMSEISGSREHSEITKLELANCCCYFITLTFSLNFLCLTYPRMVCSSLCKVCCIPGRVCSFQNTKMRFVAWVIALTGSWKASQAIS